MFVARYWRSKSHLYKLTGVRNTNGTLSVVPRQEHDVTPDEYIVPSETSNQLLSVVSVAKH